jgi:hypothetical protein
VDGTEVTNEGRGSPRLSALVTEGNFEMGIFRRQPDSEPAYTLDDMRRDLAKLVAEAREAKIHPVQISRAGFAAGDAVEQHRATTTAVI